MCFKCHILYKVQNNLAKINHHNHKHALWFAKFRSLLLSSISFFAYPMPSIILYTSAVLPTDLTFDNFIQRGCLQVSNLHYLHDIRDFYHYTKAMALLICPKDMILCLHHFNHLPKLHGRGPCLVRARVFYFRCRYYLLGWDFYWTPDP